MRDFDLYKPLRMYEPQHQPHFVKAGGPQGEIPSGCGCLVVAIGLIGYLIYQVICS